VPRRTAASTITGNHDTAATTNTCVVPPPSAKCVAMSPAAAIAATVRP
jgi:hypothetical protein